MFETEICVFENETFDTRNQRNGGRTHNKRRNLKEVIARENQMQKRYLQRMQAKQVEPTEQVEKEQKISKLEKIAFFLKDQESLAPKYRGKRTRRTT